MFDKFARSWNLVKASGAVLMASPQLLVFPAISAIAALMVFACFALPMFGCATIGVGKPEGMSDLGAEIILGARPSTPKDACWATDEANHALTDAKKNRAYAASPRVRELFPELSRVPAPPREFTIAPSVEKNTAYLASPRAKEEFPHLLRSASPATAKGGADKLKESGK